MYSQDKLKDFNYFYFILNQSTRAHSKKDAFPKEHIPKRAYSKMSTFQNGHIPKEDIPKKKHIPRKAYLGDFRTRSEKVYTQGNFDDFYSFYFVTKSVN